MALNPDIRDQAYQFFIEEAPELLQVIETGLLTLKQERSTAKVHNIMRAAHSLKGGAASVELEAIATLSHRLETIFKALYSETLELDTDLESQLLQAYDCLRLPLMEQIQTGYFDPEEALSLAEPIFTQIEEQLGDALLQVDNFIPSSSDLGVDMAVSIFEVDVAQGLEHLTRVLAHPQDYEVAGELRAQVEVFAGFAELLNQPGFGAIATTTLQALEVHPDRVIEITELALADFELARQAVLVGAGQGISPSAALVALADATATHTSDFTAMPVAESMADPELILDDLQETLPFLEEVFGNLSVTPQTDEAEPTPATAVSEDWSLAEMFTLDYEQEPAASPEPETIQAAAQAWDLEETFTGDPDYLVESTANAAQTDLIPDLNPSDSSGIIDVDWVNQVASTPEEAIAELPSLEEVFGSTTAPITEASTSSSLVHSPQEQHLDVIEYTDVAESLDVTVQSIEQIFDSLPSLQDIPTPAFLSNLPDSNHRLQERQSAEPSQANSNELNTVSTDTRRGEASPSSNLSVRVDSERLEQINNLVGELAINRNGLSLQNDQLQGSVRELLNRFVRVQNMVGSLQELSDQMLIGASSSGSIASNLGFSSLSKGQGSGEKPKIGVQDVTDFGPLIADRSQFDSLELDSYGVLHSRLQELLEEMMQLEESVDDIVLFAKQSDQTLEQQRQMLTQLRDELMWARMLPLGEVLNRFPRMLRDFSTTYHKPVSLKLSGTRVLVDKAVLEKLYDPLLHLLRNAFDHGIESPHERRAQGKPEQGQIEIRAYHQGSQTVIEVRDDGQGLNLERIRSRAVEVGLLSAEQLATTSNHRLYELIFEPGFSTASQVSELSGRGVGLDVVRAQMRSLKGTITVTSSPGIGSTFTLRLPLTLTIAKLLVCFVGSTAIALPSDSIEEIVIPKTDQVKESGSHRFLHWRGQIVPAYRLADLLEYNCPLPETSPSKALISVPSPKNWALPMLILRQEQSFLALEIDRLVTEQELVIKPFGAAVAPPSSTYGCTILGDGSLIPVIDAVVLLDQLHGQGTAATSTTITSKSQPTMELAEQPLLSPGMPETAENWQPSATNDYSSVGTRPVIKAAKAPTILVVDDAVALRRTLALTLERVGCRVLQARDGREAIEQLHQSLSVDLVVCDIEMPNMNGFEFLGTRRQDPDLSKIPVVMLTSRSNDKHRWLAMQLGATAYFTKPYLEQEFVTAIKQIIGESTPDGIPALQPSH